MNITAHFKTSLANILTSKLRSLLTLLGILVGTASVVALISSGELATQHALEQFKNLGTDLLSVSIENNNQNNSNLSAKLNLAKIDTIQRASNNILASAPYTTDYSSISFSGQPLQGNVIGATQALSDIVKIKLASGRFVSYLDGNEFFCVIGSSIAQTIKAAGIKNPLGQQLRVGNNFFTIIGIAQPWPENMFMYADINNGVIIPIGTSLTLNKYVSIQNIIFKLDNTANIDTVQTQITNTVNQLLPNSSLFFRSAKQLIESMQKQRQTFTLMLAAIGGISLIVGGIGVMNIMLVSVIERRREIGVRMAIGAKRRDIQYMFLAEAVVLTLFGGILGIIIGILISLAIAVFSHWTFHLYILPPTIGFVVSALVGIFFGYYPALQASHLDPIETLRSE
jgi:putative ABC transport system permease protein